MANSNLELIADKMVQNAHKRRGFFQRLWFDKTEELFGAFDRYHSVLTSSVSVSASKTLEIEMLVDQTVVEKLLSVGEELLLLQLSSYDILRLQATLQVILNLFSIELLIVKDIQNCAMNNHKERLSALLRLLNIKESSPSL